MASWCDTCGAKILASPDGRTDKPELGKGEYDDRPRAYVANSGVSFGGLEFNHVKGRVFTYCSRCWPPSWNRGTE